MSECVCSPVGGLAPHTHRGALGASDKRSNSIPLLCERRPLFHRHAMSYHHLGTCPVCPVNMMNSNMNWINSRCAMFRSECPLVQQIARLTSVSRSVCAPHGSAVLSSRPTVPHVNRVIECSWRGDDLIRKRAGNDSQCWLLHPLNAPPALVIDWWS